MYFENFLNYMYVLPPDVYIFHTIYLHFMVSLINIVSLCYKIDSNPITYDILINNTKSHLFCIILLVLLTVVNR